MNSIIIFLISLRIYLYIYIIEYKIIWEEIEKELILYLNEKINYFCREIIFIIKFGKLLLEMK